MERSPEARSILDLDFRVFAVLLLVVAAASTGCRKESIRAYRIPREEAPASLTDAASVAEQVRWTTPSGWEEREAGGMRAARFIIGGTESPLAEMSIIPMPRVSAGKADIVNLWRDQVRLEPIDEAGLAGITEKLEIGAAPGEMFDFVSKEALIDNKDKARILVAMLNRSGTTWFFKMTGQDEAVRQQKPTFISFLKSIDFVPGSATHDHAAHASGGKAGSAHGGHGDAGSTELRPTWTVPPGWKEVPPTQMLLAKFLLGDGGGDVTVSVFPGDMGGVPAVANLWRGQLGLSEASDAEIQKLTGSLDVMGGKAILIDMSGKKSGQDTRMIGVIAPRGDRTWFYKLTGVPTVADREKDAFIRFVQSVRYPDA